MAPVLIQAPTDHKHLIQYISIIMENKWSKNSCLSIFVVSHLPVTVRSNPLLLPMSVLSIEISNTTTLVWHYKWPKPSSSLGQKMGYEVPPRRCCFMDQFQNFCVIVCSLLVHQCCLCLLSSPPLQLLMGSVSLIPLVCSLLVHQCCLSSKDTDNISEQVKNTLKGWATRTQ
jgi:hypothetical protein